MRAWGMTSDDLHARHPRLIMLSNTGYGSTGPWAAFRAQGTSLEATMGMSHLTGYADGKPCEGRAVLSGLRRLLERRSSRCSRRSSHRERTGEGQYIDLGMYQLGVVVMPEAVLHLQAHGEELSRRGNEDLVAFASGLVPAAGEDRWLAVSIPSAEAFTRAMRVAPGADPLAVVAAWAARPRRRGCRRRAAGRGHPGRSRARRARPAHQRAPARSGVLRGGRCRPGLRPAPGHRQALPARGRARPGTGARVRGGERRRPARPPRHRRAAAGGACAGSGVIADAPTGVPTSLAPIDLAVLLASRSITRVDEDYREVLASPVS